MGNSSRSAAVVADARSRGALLAMLLRRIWRPHIEPTLPCSAGAIAAAIPRILEVGAAGLVWRRVRATHAAADPRLAVLSEVHAWQRARRLLFERRLVDAVERLRRAGIEPILLKGWSFERLYPEPGLRVHGDIDLLVDPRALPDAEAILARVEYIDLQSHLHCVVGRAFEELSGASRIVQGPGIALRILGPADELRFACLHFLSHQASRPLWLCDIALLSETAGAGADWSRLLAGPPQERDAMVCVLRLAHQGLGCELPAAIEASPVPTWSGHAVLQQWGDAPVEPLTAAAVDIRDPRRWLAALAARVPRALDVALQRRSSLLSSEPPSAWSASMVFAARARAFVRRQRSIHPLASAMTSARLRVPSRE